MGIQRDIYFPHKTYFRGWILYVLAGRKPAVPKHEEERTDDSSCQDRLWLQDLWQGPCCRVEDWLERVNSQRLPTMVRYPERDFGGWISNNVKSGEISKSFCKGFFLRPPFFKNSYTPWNSERQTTDLRWCEMFGFATVYVEQS